jgi:hypothetical protein
MTITLRGIRPPIWRRVQVPGTLSLAALHDVIQRVFGWTDSHLHQFVVADRSSWRAGGRCYGGVSNREQDLPDSRRLLFGLRVLLTQAAHDVHFGRGLILHSQLFVSDAQRVMRLHKIRPETDRFLQLLDSLAW